jgi:hypothetical protein
MRRVRSLIAAARLVLALAAILTLMFGTVPALAASSPAPGTPASSTATATPAPSGSVPSKKTPTVTFGIGPSDGKVLDGRSAFSYSASPGSVINDHFALVNISDQPLDLYVYGTDAENGAKGALSYQPRGAIALDSSAWLALPAINGSHLFHINARATVILPFQVRVPANAAPGDHTAGIAVGLTAFVQGSGTKDLTFEQRVVAKVALRISGAVVAKLTVEHLQASYNGTLNPFAAGSVTLTYTLSNVGNVNIGANQKVTISGLFGPSHSAVEASIPELLPGSSTTVSTRFRDVWPAFLGKGKAKVTPIALPNEVYPTLTVASPSTSFWAIPWPWLILIVAIAVAAAGWWWYRRRQPARERDSRPTDARGPVVPEPQPEPSV